jgi:dihydrofolate synthase / folylpolyglutamate synthase
MMKQKILTYKQAVEYLYGLQKFGIKFGLSKTSNILKALSNPHKGQMYIHVAGTNGKGSVSAMLESILMKAGLKVGFYSSPHLVRFTERFRINRKEISQAKTTELVNELRGVIDPLQPPTFFEATTAMALSCFAHEKTDISIMEVGMGGRLDSTNVIKPLVSVVTNISLEHQSFLGNRLIDIAGEKAGIIKKGVDLVTGVTQPSVISLFEEICQGKRAAIHRLGKDFRYRSKGPVINYFGMNHDLRDLRPGLYGRYQHRNTALALAVTEILETKGYSISESDIVDGLGDTVWPGRMQIISKDPLIIVDGAHNPGAVRELADSITGGFSYDRLIVVIGIMEDKDINSIIRLISPVADYIICTKPDYYRAADPARIMKEVSAAGKQGEVVDVLPGAIGKAKTMAGSRDLILITGSLFTVGEALTHLDPVTYKPDPVLSQ